MKHIVVIVGTRPEAIKMAPLVLAFRAHDPALTVDVCLTGQHGELALEPLSLFGIEPTYRFDALRNGTGLWTIASTVLEDVGTLFAENRPDAVFVQGDTLSVLSAAQAAVFHRIPVGHVEAGLRSGDPSDPFPEEYVRRQVAQIATWNFAPTLRARENLLAEGVSEDAIVITGNTVTDALRIVQEMQPRGCDSSERSRERLILVTAHRRTNWGKPMQGICSALRAVIRRHPECRVVFSVHPNPRVRQTVQEELRDQERITLLDSPCYDEWVGLLGQADLIVTDSGGLQEEGTALGKPILVMRDYSERPEAVECGNARVIGNDPEDIYREVSTLLTDTDVYQKMARARAVFGDGYVSDRIVRCVCGGDTKLPGVNLDIDTYKKERLHVAT